MNQAQPAKTMRIDLHCHSEVSWDCITPLALLPGRCREQGITVQAVTDHNEIWGAQRLKAMVENRDSAPINVQLDEEAGPLTIIIGEEISTSEGELIGLFLSQKIEPGLSPEETVQRIKDQGGLVLLPHGFDPLKRRRLARACYAPVPFGIARASATAKKSFTPFRGRVYNKQVRSPQVPKACAACVRVGPQAPFSQQPAGPSLEPLRSGPLRPLEPVGRSIARRPSIAEPIHP